jgi:methionyl-tRNA formyltransferase
MLDEIIQRIEKDNLKLLEQDDLKATYFGKRTPDDGKINWHWQIERIRNWIRAQADPYPGAFSYYKGKKVVIDEAEKTDLGYSYDIPDGTIIKIHEAPFVKTPNGVLKLTKIRNSNDIHFENNTKLM